MESSLIQPGLSGPLAEPQDLYSLIRIRGIVTSLVVLTGIGTWLAGTVTPEGLISSLPLFALVYLYDLAFFGVLRAAGTRSDRAKWRAWVR